MSLHYIVVRHQEMWHVCYQIPGTKNYASYISCPDMSMAEDVANAMNLSPDLFGLPKEVWDSLPGNKED